LARKKTIKQAGFAELQNCFDKAAGFKGKWHAWFGNSNPIILELGCGKGEFSLGLARRYPDRNVIGIDLKPDRMFTPASQAVKEGLTNIAFLHIHLLWMGEHFAPGEVSEIWITFPDPFPKKRQAKHRMVNSQFMELYRAILRPDGKIHLKTDNLDLFQYALETFVEMGNIRLDRLTFDLHHSNCLNEDTGTLTTYERRFLEMGMKINYLEAGFILS
jgi:tRNA (guanine-N7-)-methyltransferase